MLKAFVLPNVMPMLPNAKITYQHVGIGNSKRLCWVKETKATNANAWGKTWKIVYSIYVGVTLRLPSPLFV